MKKLAISLAIAWCPGFLAAQPIVDIGLFADTAPNTLQVRLLPHGPFGDVLSGLTFTIRWPASSPASLGLRTNMCPSGIPIAPTQVVVVGDYQYRTYNGFGASLLVDEGCPWNGNEEVVVMTVPVLNSADLSEFHIVNDAFTGSPGTRDFFVSLGGLDYTGVIYAGGVTDPGDGLLWGRRYVDTDMDCEQTIDMVVPFRTMLIEPGAIDAITNESGHFNMELPPGDYTLTTYADPFVHPYCPPTQVTPFTVVADNAVVLDLADTASAGVDLRALGFSGSARPGYMHGVYLDARNLSPSLSGPAQITLTFDPLLGYVDAEPPPNTVTTTTATWNLGTIAPQASAGAIVWLQVPPEPALTGTVLNYAVSVSSTPDLDPANNSTAWSTTIVNSVDPNNNQVRTSSGASDTQYFIDSDEYLEYTIHFQNTGSASALQVLVVDTLSADLDMSTFEQGVASHPFDVSFRPGRVVEWRSDDVYLPDSVSNEAESHGLVRFRIRPVQPLLPGAVLSNTASIFFDFNDPVITEPSVLTAEFSTAVGEDGSPGQLSVFPNPADRSIEVISGTGAIHGVEIRTLDGRLSRTIDASARRVGIDLAGLAPGAYVLKVTMTDGAVHQQRFIKY